MHARRVLEDKPYLQGWAVVENATDEDWGGVRMALISGRPISFQMNLYDALFLKRPVVEPELFASLRPPTYSGGFGFAGGGSGLGINGTPRGEPGSCPREATSSCRPGGVPGALSRDCMSAADTSRRIFDMDVDQRHDRALLISGQRTPLV